MNTQNNSLTKGSVWTPDEDPDIFTKICADIVVLLTKELGVPKYIVSRRDKINLSLCCTTETKSRVTFKNRTCSFFIKALRGDDGMVKLVECITEHTSKKRGLKCSFFQRSGA